MVSGRWRELPLVKRFIAATLIDILNALPSEHYPLLSLLDPLLAVAQLDLVTDLAPSTMEKLVLAVSSGEAVLPYPTDFIPLCTIVMLISGVAENLEFLDRPERPAPTSM